MSKQFALYYTRGMFWAVPAGLCSGRRARLNDKKAQSLALALTAKKKKKSRMEKPKPTRPNQVRAEYAAYSPSNDSSLCRMDARVHDECEMIT